MYKVKVLEGQTLYDISIQVYGCPEGVFELVKYNDLSIDQKLVPGQELLVLDTVPELNANNKAIANWFGRESRKPNSGDIGELVGEFEGIDFESIDFLA